MGDEAQECHAATSAPLTRAACVQAGSTGGVSLMPGALLHSSSLQLVKQKKRAELEEGRGVKDKKVIRKLQQCITSFCIFNSE